MSKPGPKGRYWWPDERSEQKRRSKRRHRAVCRETLRGRVVLLLKVARKRGRKRRLEGDATVDDVELREHCPCCGVKFVFGAAESGLTQAQRRARVTIDRIDSSRGYTKGNVELLCFRCNSLKSDATAEELMRVATYVRIFGA